MENKLASLDRAEIQDESQSAGGRCDSVGQTKEIQNGGPKEQGSSPGTAAHFSHPVTPTLNVATGKG